MYIGTSHLQNLRQMYFSEQSEDKNLVMRVVNNMVISRAENSLVVKIYPAFELTYVRYRANVGCSFF